MVPNMDLAATATASRSLTTLTPPALPRPPACTCALTTHKDPPNALAAATAPSGESATWPRGTGMAYIANSSLDWYSCKFINCPAVPIWSRKARYSELSLPAAQSERKQDLSRPSDRIDRDP